MLTVALLATIAHADPASHCAATETTYLSCPVGKKVLSLCGADGQVSYRFGAPGKVDLTWPPKPTAPTEAFTYAMEAGGPQVYSSGWTFEREGFKYEVYETFFHGEYEYGINVTPPGKEAINLPCTGAHTGDTTPLHGLFQK